MNIKFLLNIELNDVKLISSIGKVLPEEKVIGILEPELQKLYSLWRTKDREFKTMALQLEDTELTPEQDNTLHEKESESLCLMNLLFHEIKCTFHIWHCDITIKEYYQIVEFEMEGIQFRKRGLRGYN